MKLKYYLNGFGIGVLFATIILSVAFLARSSGNRMTDEEIIARARVLGMEMVSDQKEGQTITTAAEKQTKVTELESTIKNPVSTEPETTTIEPETTTAEPETTMAEPETTEAEPETTAVQNTEPERVSFEIVSGMTSESVAELLEKKGVVSDAKAFNAYIVERGYAGRIRAGRYEVMSSASYEDIVNFICP